MSGTIILAGAEIGVQPQPWNRIASNLDKLQKQLGASAQSDVTVRGVGKGAWEALCVLAPEVESAVPLWRWLGFASKESMDSAEPGAIGDEVAAPTFPDIAQAFKTALDVNGWDLVRGLGAIVDPQILKDSLSLAMGQAVRNTFSQSQSENGTSESTNGSALTPTSDASVAGPSRESAPVSEAAT